MYKYLILISLIVVVYYCFIHQNDVEGMASTRKGKKSSKKASKKSSGKSSKKSSGKSSKKSSKKTSKSSAKPVPKPVVVETPSEQEEVKPFSEQEVRTEAEVSAETVAEVIPEEESTEYIDKILNNEIPEITANKNEVNKTISVADINAVINKVGLDASVFNFKTMSDLDTAKFSATKLLELISVFKNLGIDDKTSNMTIRDLLGLSMTDETFKQILIRGNVPNSYHVRVLGKFTEIVKPIKLLTFTKEPALDDIPNKIMLNVSQVFPRGDSDDMCFSSAKLLGNLRNRRIITFAEYNNYIGKINEKCKKRDEMNTVIIAKPDSEIKPTEIKSIKEVPLDTAVGLPTLKQDAPTFQDYINNKNKAADNLNVDMVTSTNSTYNSMTGLFGF